MPNITEQDLRDKLRRLCQAATQTEVAASFGYKPQYIHDVLAGERISARLAESLGYKMTKSVVRTFTPIGQPAQTTPTTATSDGNAQKNIKTVL